MKEKIKKNLIGFIIGVITAFSISVIAATYFPSNDVTYDNKESGLSSTNVQGAIDEIYGICTTPSTSGEWVLDNTDIVTSGNGLYKDEYEDRYFYKGKNVNNYVTFNNETWRIISIEPDKTIKIMKLDSIGNQNWDTASSNNWARPANLNTYLNETYLNSLSSTAQSQIIAKDFSIGAIAHDDTNLENTVNNENSSKWNGKIALPTASEYIRSNSDIANCGNMKLIYDYNLSSGCGDTTWMNNETEWWLLSPFARSESSSNSSSVHSVSMNGYLNRPFKTSVVSANYTVRPALYLNSNVKLSGSGTSSDPFTIM